MRRSTGHCGCMRQLAHAQPKRSCAHARCLRPRFATSRRAILPLAWARSSCRRRQAPLPAFGRIQTRDNAPSGILARIGGRIGRGATRAMPKQRREVCMVTISNAAKDRLSANGLAVGVGVRGVRGVEVSRLMKTAGFDFLFIDLEHGAASVETAYSICVSALDAGIAPLVRVPNGELALGTRCLDGGALGIVIPHVDGPEEARAMVNAFRFAPLGKRSIGGAYPQFGFAAV